jgi:hypothetical protein
MGATLRDLATFHEANPKLGFAQMAAILEGHVVV